MQDALSQHVGAVNDHLLEARHGTNTELHGVLCGVLRRVLYWARGYCACNDDVRLCALAETCSHSPVHVQCATVRCAACRGRDTAVLGFDFGTARSVRLTQAAAG